MGSRARDRGEDSASRTAAFATGSFFLLLLAFGIVRTLHHAMWRDELEPFQLSANSHTLLDLFHHLGYEARAPLWHLVLWCLTRLNADPVWMQLLHAAIAAAIWILIYRCSPFTRLEKFLLLLSYFLFFEYFIISRDYALAVLCGLSFVALRQHRPAHIVLAWLALGLMANLLVHATIWSIAFAFVFILEERRHDPRFLAGAAIYLMLLAFAIIIMIPSLDFGPWSATPRLDWSSANNPLRVMFGAFAPIDPGWFGSASAFLKNPQTQLVPFTWSPNPLNSVLALIGAGIDHPFLYAVLLILPVAVCAVLTRNPFRVLEFALAYVGLSLFATLWNFAGSARHHGLVFIAMIACIWTARARAPAAVPWLFFALLAVNALGGIFTIGSEFNTFSQSRNTAHWIQQNNLAGLPLIGSRDAQVSSVAGYLGRPVYYLECECHGTFIVWNGSRKSPLSREQFRERLGRAFERIQQRDAILIRNRALTPEELPEEVTSAPLQSFTGAATDENYWVYRVTAAKP